MIATYRLNEYVRLNGPRFGDDKWKTYQDADIFLFPTRLKQESFPLVILEIKNRTIVVSHPDMRYVMQLDCLRFSVVFYQQVSLFVDRVDGGAMKLSWVSLSRSILPT